MIYHAYFAGIAQDSLTIVEGSWGGKTHQINPSEVITRMLENTYHQVIFIITPEQEPVWDRISNTWDWERFISFKMPDYVHNVNYPNRGRRLKLIVLKGIGNEA